MLLIEKISEACKAWGKPEPFFKVRTNEVMIGFKTDIGIVDNVVDNEGMNGVQMKILQLMRNNPKISAKTISEEIGTVIRNVQRHIKSLKEQGLVEREGPAKGGRWIVK